MSSSASISAGFLVSNLSAIGRIVSSNQVGVGDPVLVDETQHVGGVEVVLEDHGGPEQ